MSTFNPVSLQDNYTSTMSMGPVDINASVEHNQSDHSKVLIIGAGMRVSMRD